MTQAILSLGDLQVHFAVRGPFNRRIGSIKAVDGVSFDLVPGEVFYSLDGYCRGLGG